MILRALRLLRTKKDAASPTARLAFGQQKFMPVPVLAPSVLEPCLWKATTTSMQKQVVPPERSMSADFNIDALRHKTNRATQDNETGLERKDEDRIRCTV